MYSMMNILNQHPIRPGLEVSRELQKLMLRMKGEFMKEDGRGVDYQHLRESDMFQSYNIKTRDLQQVDIASMDEDERKAFFINIYNALTIHGLASCTTLPKSVLDVEKFWRNTAYIINGHAYSLDDIEHGVLRGNRPHPSSPELFFKEGDPRLSYAASTLDARIHFALVCGAKSCPPISVYSGTNVNAALNAAAKSYLCSEVSVNEDTTKIQLPKLLQWYQADFGKTLDEVIRWILNFLDEPLHGKVTQILHESENLESTVEYKDYDWHLNSLN